MTRPPAYEREPYRRTLAVEIVKADRDGELDYAVLDDTILYPEGGGQPADRGRLAGVAVVDVQRVDGEIRHLIESAASRGPAELELDWDRRYDHMQQHTAEIETLKLLGTEPMRGGTRLFWIAGGRVRRLLEQHEQRGAQLRELLSTGNEDLVAMTAGKLDRLQQAERRIKALQRQVAEQAARQLSSGGGPVAEAHFQDADPGFLQQIGRQFVRTAGNGVALLTASGSKGDFFLLVAGPDSEVDLRRIGPPIAELLQGRGGGSDSMFQGKAGSLAGRAEAMVLLAENLRRHS